MGLDGNDDAVLREVVRDLRRRIAQEGLPTEIETDVPTATQYAQLRDTLFHEIARYREQLENSQDTREALRESERRYRELFETMQESLFVIEVITDAQGLPIDWRYVDANPQLERYMGMAREQLVGHTYSEVVPHPDSTWISVLGVVALTGKPVTRELYSPSRGRWLHVHAYSPRAGQAAVLFTDITERKSAEEALRESRTKLEAALESMTDAVFISDTEGRFVDFNEAFATFHKFKSKADCSKTFAEYPDILDVYFANGELAPVEQWAVPRALRGETRTNEIYLLHRKDTGDRWVGSYSFAPIRNSDGTIVGSVVVGRDITEQKHAEEALRESEERFSTMANNISQLAWMADGTGWIFWYNKRWYEYTGTTPELMEGWGWQRVHDPDVLPRVLEQWQQSIETGEPFDMEFPLRGVDGLFRPFLTRVFPVKDAGGRIEYWFGTNTDISELRKAQDELLDFNRTLEQRVRERTAALEAANRELEAFSYSVSHDLRAPLRSIDGFTRMLLERYSSQIEPTGLDYLHRVRNAAVRMNRLIDDMLKLSRIGRAELRRESVDLSGLAAEVIDDLRERDPERQVQVEIAPKLMVTGDASLLRILLENLLGNAWKFTSKTAEARITIGTKTRDGECLYYVRDNGAGFDMAHAKQLFTPFQRLHTEDEFPGTGIGLAIVQRIIARHDGHVWAEGKEGAGATVYFTLGEEA